MRVTYIYPSNIEVQVTHFLGASVADLATAKGPYRVDATYFRLATKKDLEDFGVKTTETVEKESNMKMTGWLNDYVEKNRDMLFTVAFILVLDHYVFNGKFRQKVEDMIENLLKKHCPEKA